MAQHLIHVGYPKAGSKFLQAWFERHPELRYVPGGLGGYRNVYDLARPAGGGPYTYFVTSAEDLTSPNRSAGDLPLDVPTEWREKLGRVKSDQAHVCEVLRSLFPGSRILIVTRGFRGIIMSGYSQYVRAGGVLRTTKALPEDVRADAHSFVHEYFDFDYLIRLYGEAFGEENVAVLPYELLRDDHRRFLAVLEEWLGLAHVDIELGRLNPSLSPEELYWYPRISRAVAAASRLGGARSRGVYRHYIRLTFNNRLRLLIKALSLLRPGRRVTETDFPEETFEHCKGKATLLRGRPLYEPYAAEYLWDEERASP